MSTVTTELATKAELPRSRRFPRLLATAKNGEKQQGSESVWPPEGEMVAVDVSLFFAVAESATAKNKEIDKRPNPLQLLDLSAAGIGPRQR